MMKENEVRSYLNIMYIVFLIIGILSVITIIGAIIGIPIIIGSNKFKELKDAPLNTIIQEKGDIFGWSIFFGIITLPIGAVIFIFAGMVNSFLEECTKNNNTQGNINYQQNNTQFGVNNGEVQEKTFGQTVKDFSKKTVNGVKDAFGIKDTTQKLEELKKMYEEGIITKEEYDALRKKTLGI